MSMEQETADDDSSLSTVTVNSTDKTIKDINTKQSNSSSIFFAFVLASNSIGVAALAYPSAIA